MIRATILKKEPRSRSIIYTVCALLSLWATYSLASRAFAAIDGSGSLSSGVSMPENLMEMFWPIISGNPSILHLIVSPSMTLIILLTSYIPSYIFPAPIAVVGKSMSCMKISATILFMYTIYTVLYKMKSVWLYLICAYDVAECFFNKTIIY